MNKQDKDQTNVLGAAAVAGAVGAVVGATAAVLADPKKRTQLSGTISKIKTKGEELLKETNKRATDARDNAAEEMEKKKHEISDKVDEVRSSKSSSKK